MWNLRTTFQEVLNPQKLHSKPAFARGTVTSDRLVTSDDFGIFPQHSSSVDASKPSWSLTFSFFIASEATSAFSLAFSISRWRLRNKLWFFLTLFFSSTAKFKTLEHFLQIKIRFASLPREICDESCCWCWYYANLQSFYRNWKLYWKNLQKFLQSFRALLEFLLPKPKKW